MTRRLGFVAVAALSLCLSLVAAWEALLRLGPAGNELSDTLLAGWSMTLMALTATGSSLLSVWTVLRARRWDESTVSVIAVMVGLGFAFSWPAYGTLLGEGIVSTWLAAMSFVVGATCAVLGLARFAVVFPEPMTAGVLSAPGPRGKPIFATGGDPRRLLRPLQSERFWNYSGVALLALAGVTAAPSGIGRTDVTEAITLSVVLLTWATCLTALFFVAALVEAGFRAGTDDQRARMLWVRWGFLALIATFLASGGGFGLGAVGLTADWVFRLAFGALLLLPLVLVTTLWLTVFYQGAVDPSIGVRRTTLYGGLTLVVVFAFSILETLLGDLLLSQAGLPEGFAPVLAGGVVAFTLQPLHTRLRSRVDDWIEQKLPDDELASAPRHYATILFSDIVGYTALTSESEDDALTMMSVFHRQARRAAEQNKGRLVKTIGDEVLLEFKEPQQAVAAAQQLASSFAEACAPLGLPPAQLRTGIHMGEVAKRRDGDLFGDVVNMASRLQGVAEPDQIIVSQAVADQLDADLEDLGERNLKNVPEPVRCYSVKG